MEIKQDHDENSSSTGLVLGCGRSNTRHEYVSSNYIVLSCNINPNWQEWADTGPSFMPPTHSETSPVVAGVKKISTEELNNNITTDVGRSKKLRLTKDQSYLLEDTFRERSTINPKQKQVLAEQLNLRPRQIEVWFQNRRARAKLKHTEMHYEVLKRRRESLTEENRLLQKELKELKKSSSSTAVVFSSSDLSHPQTKLVPLQRSVTATTTLALCPSCQRIAHDRYAPARPKTLSRRSLLCLPFEVQ